MNRAHVERDLVPWGLKGVELGEDVLEIGPGFGATTRVLARRGGDLSVLELDQPCSPANGSPSD